MLGSVACLGRIDADVVNKAMTQVKTADVNVWVKEQIGVTHLSKRKAALGKWRRNGKSKEVVQKPAGTILEMAVGFEE